MSASENERILLPVVVLFEVVTGAACVYGETDFYQLLRAGAEAKGYDILHPDDGMDSIKITKEQLKEMARLNFYVLTKKEKK